MKIPLNVEATEANLSVLNVTETVCTALVSVLIEIVNVHPMQTGSHILKYQKQLSTSLVEDTILAYTFLYCAYSPQ